MKIQQSGIYRIRNEANGKVYIGSAVNLESRMGAHRRMLRRSAHHSIKLQRAWDKHGEESFSFCVLEHVEDKSKLLAAEQHWLDLTKSATEGYNIARKAGNLTGFRHTDETRKKMSESHKGYVKSEQHRENLSKVNTGKKMSDEARLKMRLAKLGTKRAPHSDETKSKMRAAKLGKLVSQESREKMSASRTGLKWSEARWAALEEKRRRKIALNTTEVSNLEAA